MKVAIAADLHLGSSEHLGRINSQTGLHQRLEDFLKSFDFIIDYVIDNKLDCFIVAGDLFKTRQPTTTQQREFAKRIARLDRADIPTYIMTGNHDILVGEGMAHTASVLKELDLRNIHVIDEPFVKTHTDDVTLCFMPYMYRQKLNMKSNEEVLKYYSDTLNDWTQQNNRCVLIGHQTIDGTAFSSGYVADLSVLNEIVVPVNLLKPFEASFFGHIHKYQVLKQKPLVVVPGSVDRIDFGEVNNDCGFVIYDTETKQHEHIQTPTVKLVCIKKDLTEATDLTDVVLEMLGSIDGCIVELNLKIRECDIATLDCNRIKQEIDNRARFYVGMKLDIEKVRARRNEHITERVSAEQALKEYLNSCDEYKDIADEALKEGLDIIKLSNLSRGISQC